MHTHSGEGDALRVAHHLDLLFVLCLPDLGHFGGCLGLVEVGVGSSADPQCPRGGVGLLLFARAHWCSARGHVVGRSASDANMISMGGMEKASSMKNEDHRIGAPVDSTSNPLQEGAENAAR